MSYVIRIPEVPPLRSFLRRLSARSIIGAGIFAGSLFVGAVGYHLTEQLPWLDATLNASMILTGEGPLAQLHTSGGKIFAIFYSLFSGIAFVTAVSVMMSPVLERFLHHFHNRHPHRMELVEPADRDIL
ncbi:MAG: hypothetical protein HOQ11_16395 [Gemmatimonadaceae bacterium]|nr:hypothetical protein [Gemmatimonadaceae bacterium]NUQ94452.1 hypothetical protein [Gemmatimonadaceae bacterium]NUR20412.1 hypothetical protein [Gemmatimonadaceae bacterium]NUS98982.1 hypothetical protein [Gemmatimonadaceae bacterium]